jgi:hypothetical protein
MAIVHLRFVTTAQAARHRRSPRPRASAASASGPRGLRDIVLRRRHLGFQGSSSQTFFRPSSSPWASRTPGTSRDRARRSAAEYCAEARSSALAARRGTRACPSSRSRRGHHRALCRHRREAVDPHPGSRRRISAIAIEEPRQQVKAVLSDATHRARTEPRAAEWKAYTTLRSEPSGNRTSRSGAISVKSRRSPRDRASDPAL